MQLVKAHWIEKLLEELKITEALKIKLLEELKITQALKIKLLVDNKLTIDLTNHPMSHGRSQHIEKNTTS